VLIDDKLSDTKFCKVKYPNYDNVLVIKWNRPLNKDIQSLFSEIYEKITDKYQKKCISLKKIKCWT